MLGDTSAAEAVRCFTVSSLLIADLEEELSQSCEGSPAPDAAKAQDRISRLTHELPEFLKQASHHSHQGEENVTNGANGSSEASKTAKRRLSQDLPQFLASGFVQSS